MIEMTVEELIEKVDSIMDEYGNGSDETYLIHADTGDVVLKPYDGPYESTVKETDDGDYFVEIPQRLLSKQGWNENTKLDMTIVNGNIELKELINE